MKTLYLDCGMGAAGDMLTAALLELLPDPEAFVRELNALGLPGVEYVKSPARKCGVTGTHMSVRVNGVDEGELMEEHEHHHHGHEHEHEHEHHHHHSDMASIESIVSGLPVSSKVRSDILAVYALIANAESHVHGQPVSQIHFHEVGSMDAVADVAAVCLLMERLGAEEIIASPVHVGSGTVRCAHGILPVPAPATAWILREVPIYGGELRGELCTPTGAALLKHFVSRFGAMPPMRLQNVGYGMGYKDFPTANCVRAMLGETEVEDDTVCELSVNVDDMTAEEIGFAMDRLFDAGALDVYTVPIGMKKNRPGVLLRVMCAPQKKEEMISLIFRHTTTLGLREVQSTRHVLDRRIESAQTPFGEVHVKHADGYGVTRAKYEYDDLARIAKEHGLSLAELRSRLAGI